jgi:hypothetical protein
MEALLECWCVLGKSSRLDWRDGEGRISEDIFFQSQHLCQVSGDGVCFVFTLSSWGGRPFPHQWTKHTHPFHTRHCCLAFLTQLERPPTKGPELTAPSWEYQNGISHGQSKYTQAHGTHKIMAFRWSALEAPFEKECRGKEPSPVPLVERKMSGFVYSRTRYSP